MADDVTIKFGADINDLKGKVNEVLGVFGGLTAKFAEMAAIVGGGVAFKKFIDETITLNGEALKLAKMLGITGEQAGVLNTALGDIGADADTYTGAFLHFNRALRQNSEEMQSMGVDIAGYRSGQKDANQVMMEAVQIIAQYKPGIDQTQAAMKFFGRSIEDVYKLMKLTPEIIEAARKKTQELNLTITQEGLAATKAYKLAMNDVGDVLKGVSKTIGEAVMPHFTEMAEQLASIGPTVVEITKQAVNTLVNVWETLGETVGVVWAMIRDDVLMPLKDAWQEVFGKDGPSAMEIFINALKVIEIAFVGFRIAFELIASNIKTGLALMSEYWVRFAAVAERALHFDLAGAKAEWKAGVDDHNRILEEGLQNAIKIAEKGQADLDRIANRSTTIPGGTPAGKSGTGTRTMSFNQKGGDQEKLAAHLALLKAQNEAEKNLEQEYLKEAQSMYDEAYKNGLISTKEYYDAKLAIEIKGIDSSLNAKRKELDDAKKAEADAQAKGAGATKPEERNKYEAQTLKFQTEQAKLLGEINVLEAQRVDAVRKTSAEYADVEKKVNADLLAISTARAKAAADAEIAIETEALQQLKALRKISAEDAFAIEKQMEDKSYSALLSNLNARRAAVMGTQDEIKKQNAQLDAEAEAAEMAHQAKLTQIDHAAVLERAKYSLQAQQSVQSSFATMLNDMMAGQKKLLDVVKSFATSIISTFENLIAQKFAERLFGQGTAGGNLIDKLTQPFITAIDTIVSKWIGAEIAQSAATETESAARTAFRTSEIVAQTSEEAAAAATTIATQQAASIAGVMGWAATAAAAAMASVAAIPIVGWEMAPAVGASTYANAMAYLASAAGGWGEVPEDGMLTQLHKKEMVLPASLAEPLRKMLSPGGTQSASFGGSSGRSVVQNNHFHLPGTIDKRTQSQITRAAGQALQVAQRDS